MKIQIIVILLGIVGIATGLAQIGDEQISIIVTSEGKAKISQSLFPKTFVSTIDVHIVSEKISKLLAIDEKNILLGTTQNENLLKIATLGASAVDLKYDADILTYESGVFRLKYNSELESKIKLPPLSKLVSLNTIPVDISNEEYILPPGDISLSFTIRPVTSQEFFVPVGDLKYKVEAITAAKIEEFSTNPDEIQFIIKDKAIVLTIIPKEVMNNPDDALLNGEKVEFSQFHQNSTHSWIRIDPHEKGLVRILDTGEGSEGGGCLIATAAFGSEMAPQVQFLREIRDNQLMNSNSGASFMSGFNQLYYSFSPFIADMQRENPAFKEMVKIGITPMLLSLSVMEFAESENEILGLGVSVILMNIGMYFVLPFIICYETMRFIRTRGVKKSNCEAIFSHSVLSAVKKSLFGIVVLLVLSVSVSSAFEPAYAAGEQPIRMVLDMTLQNIQESMEGMDNEEANILYEAGKSAYDDAIEALGAGNIEDAKKSALIAMELFEGATEEVLTQPPAGLGVGGIPPGLAKQVTSSSIFEVQEEITAIDEEVEQLRTLVDLNGLDIDLEEYTESITVAKTVLVSGDIPNAKNQLILANQIKDTLYQQIQEAANDNDDEIQNFANESIERINEMLENGENLGLTKKAIRELEETIIVLESGNVDDILDKTGEDSEFANEIGGDDSEDSSGNSGDAPGNSGDAPGNSGDAPGNSGDAPGNSGDAQGKSGDAQGKSGDAQGKSGDAPGQNKDNESELPPGFGAAGDNPSDNAIENENAVGLGLGKETIPPGQLMKLDFNFEASFASGNDDFYENSFESNIEKSFEKNFDGTKKGNGNGKGQFGESPGKSSNAPGKIGDIPGQKKPNSGGGGGPKGNSNGGNPNCDDEGITDGEFLVNTGTEGEDFTVQGFTGIGSNCKDVTDQIKINIESPSKKNFANAKPQPYTFQPNEPGVWIITASAAGQFSDPPRNISVASASGNTIPVISLVLPYNDPDVILWANVDTYIAGEIANPSATALDTQDGDITNAIVATDNKKNGYKIGQIFSIFYDVVDSEGLDAITIQRDVQSECPPGEVPSTSGNACVSSGGGGGGSNNPPTADAGNPQTVTEGDPVTLDGSASFDSDIGDTLTYSWVKTAPGGNPNIPALSDDTAESPTFTAPSVSADTVYTFELTVSDGNGGTDESTVDITVNNLPLSFEVKLGGNVETANFSTEVDVNANGNAKKYQAYGIQSIDPSGCNCSTAIILHANLVDGEVPILLGGPYLATYRVTDLDTSEVVEIIESVTVVANP